MITNYNGQLKEVRTQFGANQLFTASQMPKVLQVCLEIVTSCSLTSFISCHSSGAQYSEEIQPFREFVAVQVRVIIIYLLFSPVQYVGIANSTSVAVKIYISIIKWIN